MKLPITVLTIAWFCASYASADAPSKTLESVPIGSVVQDLKFIDIRALDRELKDLGEYKAYAFAFTNTTCPLVRKYLPKLVELHNQFHSQGVLFVAVNTGSSDTIRQMASQALEFQAPFYFVKDRDQSCTHGLGAKKTPEVVVLDAGHSIRYRGRIDDQMRIGGTKPSASREDLKEAIMDVLADQPVRIPQTETDGCIIGTPEKSITTSTDTWSGSIAALVHEKCAGCHRPNTAAPFPLISHEDVVANASMIAQVVTRETMPPWYASREQGPFQNDCGLTQVQQKSLLAWIAADCPLGDAQAIPTAPEIPESEWRIGKPDLIITMKEEHTIPPTGFIPYQYVVLPQLFLWETWVEAFEIKPLNPEIVHHCNMAYMTKDGASNSTFITGYVPGGQPMDLGKFDNGVAYRLPAGSMLGLQIHYTSIGTEQKGKIQVGLRFPRREVRKRLHHFVLDPRGWEITPRTPAFRIEDSHQLQHNANLLGLFTHMHVRGRDMTFFAQSDGQTEETLLQIPNYNFEWQLGYEFSPGQKNLSKGSTIRAVAHFDNSDFNPYNPDPEVGVRYGPQTVDEMFNGFAFYVDNDEDLSIQVNPKTGAVVSK